MSVNEKDIMQSVVEYAKGQGADGTDVILDSASTMSFKSQANKLEEYKVSSSQVVGIRVIKNNRAGVCYSEALDEDSLKYMVNQALGNASYAKENEYEQIATSAIGPIECEVNEENGPIEIAKKVDFSLALESEIMACGPEVKSAPYNGFSEYESHRLIMNSQGHFCRHFERGYSCFTSALLEKNGANSMFWGSLTGRRFADLKRDEIVRQSYQVAKDLLVAKPIKTGRYSVIFDTNTFDSLFNAFAGIFSAKGAINGVNPMKDRLGDQITHGALNVSDRPLYKEGMSYGLFDAEGARKQDLTLIEKGVFKTFLHNSATAKEMQVENTHNASRSARSSLGVSGSNTFIDTGSASRSDLYTGSVFEIIKLDGMHSGIDFISGDFSCAASGYLYQDGQKIQAVKGVTISGNFYKMLMNIESLGSELEVSDSQNFFAPLVRFAELSVAGV